MVYRYTKPPSQRQLQVAQEIRNVLSQIILEGKLKAPFLEKVMITVSEVRISSDLKLATAFLVLSSEESKDLIMEFFKQNAPLLRKLIVSKIKLRFAPEIRYAYDESYEQATKIESILHNLNNKE